MADSYVRVQGVMESAAPNEGRLGPQWKMKVNIPSESKYPYNLFMNKEWATPEEVMSGEHTFGLIRGNLKKVDGVPKDGQYNSNYFWNVVQFDEQGDGVTYHNVPNSEVGNATAPSPAGVQSNAPGVQGNSDKSASLLAAARLVASTSGGVTGEDRESHLDNLFMQTVRIAEGFNEQYFSEEGNEAEVE